MSRFGQYLKNIFFIILILQFLPLLFVNIRKVFENALSPKARVGVIPIKGIIMDTNRYATQVKKYFEDDSIKAIVLKIDSPGGAPAAAQELFQQIIDLKKEHNKPVIAYAENLCASAAYYIAIAADHIIAQPASMVGSIGAFIAFPSLQTFMEQYKIKYTVIQSGSYKTGPVIFRDLTPKQKNMLQELTDDTYDQFKKAVVSRRPSLSLDTQKQWADGQVFSGAKGLQIGLIDQLGSHVTLSKEVRERAAIEEDIVFVYPPKPSVFKKLFGTEEQAEYDEPQISIWPSFLQKPLERLVTPISW